MINEGKYSIGMRQLILNWKRDKPLKQKKDKRIKKYAEKLQIFNS